MDEKYDLDITFLPARESCDTPARASVGGPTPRDHVTGAELTPADLGRTLLALKSLDHS